jgi:hypothetical protein
VGAVRARGSAQRLEPGAYLVCMSNKHTLPLHQLADGLLLVEEAIDLIVERAALDGDAAVVLTFDDLVVLRDAAAQATAHRLAAEGLPA